MLVLNWDKQTQKKIRRDYATFFDPVIAKKVSRILAEVRQSGDSALRRYTRPIIVDEPLLEAVAGRHPVIEQWMEDTREGRFIANPTYAEMRDGQVRVRWDATPVDVFLDTTEYHVEAAQRRRMHEFGGRQVPFLGCSDLAVFKAFVNRTQDWADLENMVAIRAINLDQTIGVLVRYLGEDDERVARLRGLATPGE